MEKEVTCPVCAKKFINPIIAVRIDQPGVLTIMPHDVERKAFIEFECPNANCLAHFQIQWDIQEDGMPKKEETCIATPINLSPEEKLLHTIFGEPVYPQPIRIEIDGVKLRDKIFLVLSDPIFSEREIKVLRMRFGFDDALGKGQTLDQVKIPFNVTRERIRQIEGKALRKLRHPSRTRQLKPYLMSVTKQAIGETYIPESVGVLPGDE
jgi:hypothetical protein